MAIAEDASERLLTLAFDRVKALLDAEHDNVRAALTWTNE
jgi:hypothetical protein